MFTWRGAPRRLALMLLAPLVLAATPASAWVDTRTQAMPLTRLVSTGAMAPATPMRIVVGLQQRNGAELEAFIHRATNPDHVEYGRLMSEAQYEAAHMPTIAQARAVTDYLAAQGFRSIELAGNRMLVTAEATAAIVQQAFNTSLATFSVDGRTVFTNLKAAQVPDHLGAIVLNVSGLNNIALLQTHKLAPDVPGSVRGYGPQQLMKAYYAGATPWGTGTRIGIFMSGRTLSVVNSLAKYRSVFGLPPVPVTTWLQTGVESADDRLLDEWAMDTQTATGIAGNVAELRLYVAASMLTSDLAITLNRFASEPGVSALSASIGICEVLPMLSGDMALIDNALKQGVAVYGKTMFASSGDAGSACSIVTNLGLPLSGPPNQQYPATSPWVVGVGGTTLFVSDDGSYSRELAWSSSGGGYSYFEAAPAWQGGKVPMKAVGKGVPDIAFVGDPNTGAVVYTHNTRNVIGGTSLSSPLALGAWARIQTARGNALGFAAPLFYKLEPNLLVQPVSPTVDQNGFHDILLGCNGLYCATPKWDFVTGIGTPAIQFLNTFIR